MRLPGCRFPSLGLEGTPAPLSHPHGAPEGTCLSRGTDQRAPVRQGQTPAGKKVATGFWIHGKTALPLMGLPVRAWAARQDESCLSRGFLAGMGNHRNSPVREGFLEGWPGFPDLGGKS